MKSHRATKFRSSMYFAASMAISAAYCLAQPGVSPGFDLLAAGSSVVGGAAMGYWLGSWYLPVQGERPTFELVACPILVALIAPIFGATILLSGLFVFRGEGQIFEFLVALVPLSALGALAFWSKVWPVILVSFSGAGFFMARFASKLPRVST